MIPLRLVAAILSITCSGCDLLFSIDPLNDATDAGSGSLAPDAATIVDGHANDGHVGGDSNNDAEAALVTLSETSNDVVAPGSSISCPATGNTTGQGSWYRVFRLSDFGIVKSFTLSNVAFAVDRASGATDVTVSVGLYSGTVGAQTLTLVDLGALTSVQTSVPNNNSPQMITTQIAATIPADGVFVVEVSIGSLAGVGYLEFGATDATQTLPGYFSTIGGPTCGAVTSPETTTTASLGHLIIEANGN